jgi:hypothetical protein
MALARALAQPLLVARCFQHASQCVFGYVLTTLECALMTGRTVARTPEDTLDGDYGRLLEAASESALKYWRPKGKRQLGGRYAELRLCTTLHRPSVRIETRLAAAAGCTRGLREATKNHVD